MEGLSGGNEGTGGKITTPAGRPLSPVGERPPYSVVPVNNPCRTRAAFGDASGAISM
jgi:hypothetical protein